MKADLKKYAGDPAEFRNDLLVDVDGQVQVLIPPRDRGNTWSLVRSSLANCWWQYWHVYRSRL